MKKTLFFFFIITLFTSKAIFLFSEEKAEVAFTSLYWPPYSGEELSGQGFSAIIAREAFAAVGYDFKIDFYHWNRAVTLARQDSSYAGYFPEYYSPEIEEDFIFSDPIGESPLGFIESSDNPVSWNSLYDLKGMIIGTVFGYVNTKEFDRMAREGYFYAVPVNNDLLNIRKVLFGRVPLAVMDRLVFQYLMHNDEELSGYRPMIQFNSRLLERKKLYLCFRRTPGGERLADIFNEGLKAVDVRAITETYLEELYRDTEGVRAQKNPAAQPDP